MTRRRDRWWTAAAALLELPLLVFTPSLGLLAPPGAVAGFAGLAGAAVVVLVALTRAGRPRAALLVAPAHLAVLVAALTAGEHLAGWTA